jgi:phenylalanyl-tRNA synthetase beta chain
MEYSLYTLNKKAKLNNLTSEELINTLNLIGFEVDGISNELLKTNQFILDKKLLIKIPANREDLLTENLLLEDLSLLFLFQIYKIWEKIKINYLCLIKEHYQNSFKIKQDFINNNNLNCIAYKIDFVLEKEKESPLWLKNKLLNNNIGPKNLLVDLLNLIIFEFGSNFGLSISNSSENQLKIELLLNEQIFETKNNSQLNLPKGSVVLKDQKNNVNSIFSNLEIFIDQEISKNEKLNKNNQVLSLTFIFNTSFEDRNFIGDKNIKKLLPFLRKSFSQNLQLSFQRLLTLLEIVAEAKILKVSKTKNTILSLNSHKKLKLNKKLLTNILNLQNYDLNVFEKAGLKIILETEEDLYFEIPSTRRDLERDIDLIEEYSRFVGYKNFSEIIPVKNVLTTKTGLKNYEFIQNFFLNYGFNEVFTNSIQTKKFQKNQIDIQNPLNQDFYSLRTSILPELFKIFEINLKLGASNLNFFELGRVFKRVNDKIIEQDKLSGIFQFKFHARISQPDYNWLVLKGFFEVFLSNFNYTNVVYEAINKENLYFHPTRSSIIKINNKILGTIGEINPKIGNLESSKTSIYVFDFNLNHFKNYKMKTEIKVASEYSKYPSIFKDLSFLIDKKVNFTQLKKEIEKSTKKLKKLNFFNVYFDESFLKETINIVIRLEFKSENETLTNEFIEEEIINVKKTLKELYNVQFRE